MNSIQEDAGDFPKTEEGKFIFSDVHFMDTWKVNFFKMITKYTIFI